MKRTFFGLLSALAMLISAGCTTENYYTSPTEQTHADEFNFIDPVITKWYNNKTAVISLAYDNTVLNESYNLKVLHLIDSLDLTMSFEAVTHTLLVNHPIRQYLVNVILPNPKYSFFGHGHTHINHDTLLFEQSYASFKACYEAMVSFNMKPVAYAYPEGRGQNFRTQIACQSAGFLSARNAVLIDGYENNFIMPYDEKEPKNWFLLPSLQLWDSSVNNDPRSINDASEFIPYLNSAIEKKAWITTMYHNIGNPTGWGWFKYDEFKKSMEEIKKRNFWVASMSDVTLYIREKNKTTIDIEYLRDEKDQVNSIEVTLSDNLPNDRYDHYLTVVMEIPDRWTRQEVLVKQKGKIVSRFTSSTKQVMLNLLPNEEEYKLELL